jgi:hypothetical protein
MSKSLGSLFSGEPEKMARRSDPKTSLEAARQLVKSGAHGTLQLKVLGMVRDGPPGQTARELAGGDAELHQQVWRRLPELEKLGLVLRGEPRRSRGTNRRATTWWPNER